MYYRRMIARMTASSHVPRGAAHGPLRVASLLCFLLIASYSARAQERRADTLRVDSTHAARPIDSAATGTPVDTARLIDHGAPLGSMVERDASSGISIITKRDLVWERYFTSYDVLAHRLPAVPISMGQPGLVRAFSIAGAGPAALAVNFNGRPLYGAGGGVFAVDLYPAEFLERVEVLRGARAAVFGTGESLIALNFTAPRYNAAGSYVRIWYSQGPSNTTNTDVTYARDLRGRTNMSLGFRRLVSDGVFTGGNQRVNTWSARGTLRKDFGGGLTMSLTELFSDATRGASGGLTATSANDDLSAQVLNDSLAERELRHDLTLAARWYPSSTPNAAHDTPVAAPPDTLTRFDAALFFTYNERTLLSRDHPLAVGYGRQLEGITGARLGATTTLGALRVAANGNLQHGRLTGTRADVGGLFEVDAAPAVLRGGLKLSRDDAGTAVIVVAEGAAVINDSLSLRATLRQRTQVGGGPTCLSPTSALDVDSVRSLGAHATGLLAEAEIVWKNGAWSATAGGSLRKADPLACLPFSSYTVASGWLDATVPIAFLSLDQHLVLTFAPELYRALPTAYGVSDLSGRFRLFGGNLDLKLGTALEYQSQRAVLGYDDLTAQFIALRANPLTVTSPPLPNWSAYAQARIGSAYLRVEIRNILGAESSLLNRYPSFGRGFYLGVNWALVD